MAQDSVEAILDDLQEAAESGGKVAIRDMHEAVGNRGTGVFLLIPGLLGMSPLGAIPTVPTILAILVFLASIQMAFGRKNLWIPEVLSERSVESEKVGDAVEKLRGPAKWLDRHFGQRLSALTSQAVMRTAAITVTMLTLIIPPAELVPLAAIVPFAAIASFGLAMVLRDGAAMLVSFALTLGAVALILTAMP